MLSTDAPPGVAAPRRPRPPPVAGLTAPRPARSVGGGAGEQFLIQLLFSLYVIGPTAALCYALLRVMDFAGAEEKNTSKTLRIR